MRVKSTKQVRTAITGLCAALFMAGSAAPVLASSLQDAIKAAEMNFGGKAFEAERYREDGSTYVDVELLSGNQIIEAEFLADGSQLTDVEVFGPGTTI